MDSNVYIVEVVESRTVVAESDNTGMVQVVESVAAIVSGEQNVSIVQVGTQGPPGAGGTAPETHYDQRSDVFSDTVIYRAGADQGSLDSAPVWRIRRITINYGDQVTTTTAYPSGEQTFTFRWDQRTTYNYE